MSNLTREEQHARDLAAVKQQGSALKYVEVKTEEICLAAVKKNAYALLHVEEQTEEICLAAVKQYGYALGLVNVQTEEICLAAVKQNGRALEYVDEQFKERCKNSINGKTPNSYSSTDQAPSATFQVKVYVKHGYFEYSTPDMSSAMEHATLIMESGVYRNTNKANEVEFLKVIKVKVCGEGLETKYPATFKRT